MAIEFPAQLSDNAVLLRTLEESDAAAYAQAFVDDPDLGRQLGFDQEPDEKWARDTVRRAS